MQPEQAHTLIHETARLCACRRPVSAAETFIEERYETVGESAWEEFKTTEALRSVFLAWVTEVWERESE